MILFKNGVLHSLENEHQTYHQMLTDNGVIVAFDDDIKDVQYDEIIDLKGAHLYPGFVDSHIHLLGYGQQLSRPTLKGLTREKEIIDVILKHPEYVVFDGYLAHSISFETLNQISQDRRIVLRHQDYHAATVNQHVLDDLSIKQAGGLLKEEQAQLAMDTYDKPTSDMLKNMFKNALSKLYAFGVTGGHSDDLAYFNGYHETLQVIEDVLKTMPFRTHLLMHHHILDDYLKDERHWLDQHPYLQLGAIKMFYDGTFSSMTALVSQPYVNDQYGYCVLGRESFETLVRKVRKASLPIAVHVIGDQGLSEVLDILRTYPVKDGLHDRIIHASMWQENDYIKAQNLSIICDIQPQFVSSDIPAVLNVFKSKPTHLYPWHSLQKHHIVMCGGSDAPVEIPNPLLGMYDAIYRETSIGVYHEEACLTRFEALKLYTTYANIPTYDHKRGLLKKRYVADFTVLEEDILKIDKNKFIDNKVLMTIIDENVVFKA